MRKITGAGAMLVSVAMLVAIAQAAGVMAHAGKGGDGWIHVCITNGHLIKGLKSADAKCPGGSSPAHWARKGTGEPGPQGPKGDPGEGSGVPGPKDDQGADGSDGVSGWVRVVGTATAANKKVVGGGYVVVSSKDAHEVTVIPTWPSDDDTWTATGEEDSNSGAASWSIQAYALCVTAN